MDLAGLGDHAAVARPVGDVLVAARRNGELAREVERPDRRAVNARCPRVEREARRHRNEVKEHADAVERIGAEIEGRAAGVQRKRNAAVGTGDAIGVDGDQRKVAAQFDRVAHMGDGVVEDGGASLRADGAAPRSILQDASRRAVDGVCADGRRCARDRVDLDCADVERALRVLCGAVAARVAEEHIVHDRCRGGGVDADGDARRGDRLGRKQAVLDAEALERALGHEDMLAANNGR